MAIRLASSDCRIALSLGDKDGAHVSHVYCQSRQSGLKCRLDGKPGKKAYVMCRECFEPVVR